MDKTLRFHYEKPDLEVIFHTFCDAVLSDSSQNVISPIPDDDEPFTF